MRHFINKIPLGIILLGVTLIFSNCKKEHLGKDGSIEQAALTSDQKVNAHIKFTAEETSYSSFKNPVRADNESSEKYMKTLPTTKNYEMSLDLDETGMNLILDNISFKSPVESWNKNSNVIKKVVNDGNKLKSFDATGKIILEQDANLSKPTPADVYNSFADMVSNNSIQELMEGFVANGATVKEGDESYFVRTTSDNPNFEKNAIYIYSKASSKLLSYMEFNDNKQIINSKFVYYDESANPSSVYTQNYTYYEDGDVEKATQILKLSNVIISLN